jgi:hypothetical protein
MLQQPFVLRTTMMPSLDVNHTFNRPITQITNLLHEPQCQHFQTSFFQLKIWT